jgi:predicted negative regulator of RcsB-dependent stress response
MVRQNAGDAYARAVAELAHNLGAGSYVAYATLRLAAQAARKESRKAQADLERHIRDHGCGDAA